MNDNVFPEFKVNSNLAARNPPGHMTMAVYMFSIYCFRFSRYYLRGLNIAVLRVSKAFSQLAPQMRPW